MLLSVDNSTIYCTMNRKSKPPFRCSLLSIIVACLSLVSFSVVAQEIDYTCDPNRDYGNPKAPDSCPEELIQNGICDNPNHGGLEESCRGEDCIDCNFYCKFKSIMVNT